MFSHRGACADRNVGRPDDRAEHFGGGRQQTGGNNLARNNFDRRVGALLHFARNQPRDRVGQILGALFSAQKLVSVCLGCGKPQRDCDAPQSALVPLSLENESL